MKSAIDRLLECPSDTLTVRETHYVLGVSVATVARMVNAGLIGCNRIESGRGCGHRQPVSIPRASLVRYMVKVAHGDAREILMVELAAKCRDLLPFAKMELDRLAALPATAAVPVPGLRKSATVKIQKPSRCRVDETQMNLF